jgi:hypothetical protein
VVLIARKEGPMARKRDTRTDDQKEILRLKYVNDQLLAMLRKIVNAWESVPDCDAVPPEINDSQMWDDAVELLDSLEP